MTNVVISLLRGVNVGGHHKIRMDALKTLYESLGLGNVRTFLQSGNVLFTTDEANFDRLARRIEDAIEKQFGFRPSVILRTPSELREVIRANPFAARTEINPGHLIVTFLASDPGQEARDTVLAMRLDPEELVFGVREHYIHFPNGAGQSKLPNAAIERVLRTPGTGRNWNSVTKMLELAEEIEALL
jgi:uncharacterized protein (DUF1697 family)